MQRPTADEILAVLRDIESGALTVKPVISDPEFGLEYAGDQAYEVSNGWAIVVFIDCNSFDYIERVLLPDDTRVEVWDIPGWEEWCESDRDEDPPTNGYERVRSYRPPQEVVERVYGIKDPP
jgi:hypothetical protein